MNMNKSIIYSGLLGVVLFFTACDPITQSGNDLTGKLTADQLDVKATPVVVNGQKTNKIVLENNSPVLSFWNYGMGTTSKAYDEVLVTSTGDMIVQFTGRNGDGSTVTKDINVNVETIYFPVTGLDKFIGEGSKTWVWDEFSNEQTINSITGIYPYGTGGVGNDKAPAWWGLEYGKFSESDATMTFALDGGAIFTKTLKDGTQQKGTFSFNLTKKVGSWSQGILSLKGATIPHAVSLNEAKGEAYDFYILELEDDQLVLANVKGNGVPNEPSGEVNIWMFRPEGYVAADNSQQIAYLTGGSEKVWSWGKGEVFGNGAATSSTPGWWILDSDGVNEQKPNEGTGATMVFGSDESLTLHLADGSSVSGTYKVNMGKFVEGWSIGTLTTKDASVLAGISINEGKIPVNSFHILSLDEKQLVLGYIVASGSEGWFWIFNAQE
ncbi:hypothetical protein EZS27_006520 [termite gut metagenome]|uniref:Lipoprotein n=1 Tax=termite gut metagenome TaxID=433724 RepID=A0A5J4SJ53_9ZZZZ